MHRSIVRPSRSGSTVHDGQRRLSTRESRWPLQLAVPQPCPHAVTDQRCASARAFRLIARASKIMRQHSALTASSPALHHIAAQPNARRSQIPIAHRRGTNRHCLPAVSSPEASRTPAARACADLHAAAGIREPLTVADISHRSVRGVVCRPRPAMKRFRSSSGLTFGQGAPVQPRAHEIDVSPQGV